MKLSLKILVLSLSDIERVGESVREGGSERGRETQGEKEGGRERERKSERERERGRERLILALV